MSKKSCFSCNGPLRFNRQTGFFECTYCGKLYIQENEETPLSLAGVDRLMLDHKYKEAKDRLQYLIDLEPENDMFTLRSFLCDFQFNNTVHLLKSLDNDPAKALEVKYWQYWDDFRNQLPNDNKEFVDRVVEYCDLCQKYGELQKKFGKDTPAPTIPLKLEKNEKLVQPKRIDAPSISLAFLVTLFGVGIPAVLIGKLLSPNISGKAHYESYVRTVPASSPYAKQGSEGVVYAVIIAVALSIVVALLYPSIRAFIFRKKRKSGKIQERADGSFVKTTKKDQNHEEELTESQTLYLEMKKIEERKQEVLTEVAKREAEI